MEEKTTLTLDYKAIKNILAKHYFWIDYQTKEESYDTTNLEIKFIEKGRTKKIAQFILTYEKIIDPLSSPIKKQYIISQDDFNNIIDQNLLNEGYKIDDFEYMIRYGLNNGATMLNCIKFKLKKREKTKTKTRGWRKKCVNLKN